MRLRKAKAKAGEKAKSKGKQVAKKTVQADDANNGYLLIIFILLFCSRKLRFGGGCLCIWLGGGGGDNSFYADISCALLLPLHNVLKS